MPISRQLLNSPKRIVLVDGKQLAAPMFEHNVGVSPVAIYERKRVDADFFSEE
jgi:restriction system protein